MSETSTEEERIGQNWPKGLKDQVRALVGTRGVTAFTVTAVRNELTRRQEQADAEFPQQAPGGGGDPAPEAPEEAPERAATASPRAEAVPDVTFDNPITVGGVPAEERNPERPFSKDITTPIEDPEPESDARPDERGPSVKVDAPPTLGVAAKFSSSSSALDELKAKAAALGIKSASQLPRPTIPKRDDDPPLTEDVSVVERQDPEPDEAVVAMEEGLPEDYAPHGRTIDVGPVTVVGEPVHPPLPPRNLDDIDVDF